MKPVAAILVTLMVVVLAAQLFADVSVENRGSWPDTWPKELEPLRSHSRTIEGPLGGIRQYEMPFNDRDAFESAWKHLLKVRSPKSPIVLIRGPYSGTGASQGSSIKAGVLIHSHTSASSSTGPVDSDAQAKGDTPVSVATTALMLVVDGNVVDLNRIPLPENTYIQDERFKDSDITKR